ncbi:MAG: cytochrome oxidase putative small subunit CydP [Rhizomicrobium sp.]
MTMRYRLGREIGTLICIKVVLLGALYFLFFTEPAPNDPSSVAAHVMGDR